MSARRCTLCGINYPDYSFKYGKCPVHPEESTRYFSDLEPDVDWEGAAKRLLSQRALDEAVKELIPIIDGRVKSRDGQLWVSSWDIINSGPGHRLKFTDLIQIGVQVFEIQAYHEPTREYLVRAFSMTLSAEDLAALSVQPST